MISPAENAEARRMVVYWLRLFAVYVFFVEFVADQRRLTMLSYA